MYEKDNLINPEEGKILKAVLDVENKTAEKCMTDLHQVYMIDAARVIDEDLL
jgi:CBS domain containing-hemolysin-like protein